LADYGVGTDRYGERRVQVILDEFQRTMREQLLAVGHAGGNVVAGMLPAANDHIEPSNKQYTPHC
jgi:hypothetical protein